MQPSPYRKKERILGYGRSNSGKSSMWLALANWISDTDSSEKLHIGDTDNAYDAMGYKDIDHIVTATHITDYISALEWARKTQKNVTPNDWVAFDLADKAWPWAQEHYWTQRLGDDLLLGDIYLRNQQGMEHEEGGELMAGAHGANWGTIYKYYHGLINTILNLPCHVLFIAAAKEIRADTKAPIVAQYKNTGFYPAGPPNENELAHNFHILC